MVWAASPSHSGSMWNPWLSRLPQKTNERAGGLCRLILKAMPEKRAMLSLPTFFWSEFSHWALLSCRAKFRKCSLSV